MVRVLRLEERHLGEEAEGLRRLGPARMAGAQNVDSRQAVERIGANRVMYGSDASNGGYDSHYVRPGAYQEVHMDAVRLIGLLREQEEMVLGGSVAKLLGVD